MKIKFLLLTLVSLASLFSYAENRKRYSVTGVADDSAWFYDSTVCSFATQNAQYKASQLCYEEGFNNGWTYASYGECSDRWFGIVGGKKVEMTFYCR